MSTAPSSETKMPTLIVRSDIKAHIRNDDKIVLEDTAEGKHYRLGPDEYRFYVSLTQQRDIRIAHQVTQEHCPQWTKESTQQFLQWLTVRKLIEFSENPTSSEGQSSKNQTSGLNPLYTRIPLGSPEPILKACHRWLKPLVRRESLLLVGALICVSGFIMLTSWTELSRSYQNLLTPGRAITLALAGLLLKLVHELAHGIACQHWGARVKKCGIALILGVPIPYVDLSESCRFPQRRHRIFVALAGVITECSIAAITVILWYATGSPFIERLATDVLFVVALGTILFNLNPLMKFDGYYVLVEALRIDNLYMRGVAYTRSLFRSFLFGLPNPAAAPVPLAVKVYGIASLIWRLLLLSGIAVAAIVTLQGLGILLILWATYATWIAPAWKRKKQSSIPNSQTSFGTLLTPSYGRAAFLSLLFITGIWFLPIPIEDRGFALVEYDPPAVIRSPANCFVQAVHVSDGKKVQPGHQLLTLHSDQLQLSILEIQTSLHKNKQKLRAAIVQQDAPAVKQIETEIEGLEQTAATLQEKLNQLTIVAPVSGVITSRRLDELEGMHLEQGEELAGIGSESNKRLRLIVDQELSENLNVGDTVRYLGPDGTTGNVTIERILPRMTKQTTHPSLGVDQGGPLAVTTQPNQDPQFLNPQAQIVATLDESASKELHVGQRVTVAFGKRQNLSEWLWAHLSRDLH